MRVLGKILWFIFVAVVWTVLVGAVAAVIGTLLWESKLLEPWHKNNPVDAIFSWLSSTIALPRAFVIALVAWLLGTFVYIFFNLRSIKIYTASYNSPQVYHDVTETLREKVEREGFRTIPITNAFLGGDPHIGIGKTLTAEYSVWGRRKTRTAQEGDHLRLN